MASNATPAAARWSDLIDRQEASGQTLGEFSAANGLNRNTLAWWRWELGRTRSRKRTAFVELVLAEPEAEPMAIALDSFAACVVVDERTDLALLGRVLDVLC